MVARHKVGMEVSLQHASQRESLRGEQLRENTMGKWVEGVQGGEEGRRGKRKEGGEGGEGGVWDPV